MFKALLNKHMDHIGDGLHMEIVDASHDMVILNSQYIFIGYEYRQFSESLSQFYSQIKLESW